jgi:uncharacterized protein (DUF924 family)
MMTETFETVLRFWFPNPAKAGLATMVRQMETWFRGSMDGDIIQHFAPLWKQATEGELDAWADQPRSRLSLILILDQFSRSLHKGTARAFSQDLKASTLALEGIQLGQYAALETPWEKTFFFLPLGHSEDLKKLDIAVTLANQLVQESPQEYRPLLEFSAEQARRHREVVARFGRQPHRNQALGRPSTPEELKYIAHGELVHQRSLPSHLSLLIQHS